MASITACFARVAKTLTQQEREQILTPLREEFMAAHAAALAGGATDPRASALRILDRMLGADAPADARKNAENAAAAPVAESLAPGRSADGDAGVATSQGGGSAATHADPGQPAGGTPMQARCANERFCKTCRDAPNALQNGLHKPIAKLKINAIRFRNRKEHS